MILDGEFLYYVPDGTTTNNAKSTVQRFPRASAGGTCPGYPS